MNLEEWLAEHPEATAEMDSMYEALYAFIEDGIQDIPDEIAEILAEALDEGDLYL